MEVPCKNYERCGRMIQVKDGPSPGRGRECCSSRCRQAVSRRERANKGTHSHYENRKQSQREARSSPKEKREEQDPIQSPPSPETNSHPAVQCILRHQIVVERGSYHCRICGWSWSELPTRSCPTGLMYSPETKPAHLLTHDQLKKRGLRPGDVPDAYLYRKTGPGWGCLYDVRKAQPDPIKVWKITPEGQAS